MTAETNLAPFLHKYRFEIHLVGGGEPHYEMIEVVDHGSRAENLYAAKCEARFKALCAFPGEVVHVDYYG